MKHLAPLARLRPASASDDKGGLSSCPYIKRLLGKCSPEMLH